MSEKRRHSLYVHGPMACFTRPELKVERVSYEVMTPSAARGIFEAILWKPAIEWRIHRISVLAPIQFTTLKRNEVNSRAVRPSERVMAGQERLADFFADEDRAQRTSLVLREVSYVVEASFDLTARAGPEDSAVKFSEMFERRVEKGQCFRAPYLGCREFECRFEPAPASFTPIPDTKSLGMMLHDLEFAPKGPAKPRFFRAALENGVLNVPDWDRGVPARHGGARA